MPSNDRRLLLVHAHPDDETINNGATMARYVAEGASVTLVTCTLGEMGEVLVEDLGHLAYERDGGLGQYRIGELEAAMRELKVTDHRFLGAPGRYHDSGMVWSEGPVRAAAVGADLPPGAFWTADLKLAADDLVPLIRELHPQVLVTYDDFGGYGHPDHVQAHRVAMYAATLAAAPSYRPDLGEAWDVPKIYWAAMSETAMRSGLRALRASGDTTTFGGMDPEGDLPPFAVGDALISAKIDGAEFVDAKLAAMRSYPTQIKVEGGMFALADEIGQTIWAQEYYRLVKGSKGRVDPDTGWEDDLFAGVA